MGQNELETILLAVTAFIGLIVLLVSLHELGHYLVGRMFGLIPKAFSVGMGPELYAVTDRHGTRWKLSALPLGGYVKFAGEMHPGVGTEEERAEPYNFASLARWKRACIVAAGPVTNLLIAASIFLALGMILGKVEADQTVSGVTQDGPAYQAGLREGHRITGWNGNDAESLQLMQRWVSMHPGEDLIISHEGADGLQSSEITVERIQRTDQFGNNFEIGDIGLRLDLKRTPITSVSEAMNTSIGETANLLRLQAGAMIQIVTGKRSVNDISGPIRMAKISGEQMSLGWLQMLYFAALLSIAIAFMNLLPVPGLDGGYLALYAAEAIRGSDTSRKTLQGLMKGGYAAIAILMVFAITNDLRIVLSG